MVCGVSGRDWWNCRWIGHRVYTGGAPVRKIAKDVETGPATVMISGLITGMQSVAILC